MTIPLREQGQSMMMAVDMVLSQLCSFTPASNRMQNVSDTRPETDDQHSEQNRQHVQSRSGNRGRTGDLTFRAYLFVRKKPRSQEANKETFRENEILATTWCINCKQKQKGEVENKSVFVRLVP